ncbi:MAG: NAD(P)/FAD-dependent oxidoreductase [Bacillota bacterium]
MYDVIIIGAGIIGSFIARELARYDIKAAILEKSNDVSNGTTKANSAIIHCGYDAKPGSLKAKLNVKGNPMFDKICKELDVPFKRIGSLVVASSEEEMNTLQELYERGRENGLTNIWIIDGAEVERLEPNLNKAIIGALYAPDCGIVGPFELAVALAENAVENGVELFLDNEVKAIEKKDGCFKITSNSKTYEARCVINCGGVSADEISNMVTNTSFRITPRRGQYFVLDKGAGKLVNSVIFQCPTAMGKGVLVLPTVHGNLLVGPDSQDVHFKDNVDTTLNELENIKKVAEKSIKGIPFDKSITNFTGLRATPDTGDFIIEEADVRGFINVAGIESPGLSASPAIAEYVAELVNDILGGMKSNSSFNPNRKPVIRFNELGEKEKAEAIKRDPRYGKIVCRCESITEGEIVDAIHRKVGARTLDGVKRRVRPGMGRCQGGFCAPRVMEILSRELGVDMLDILKDDRESKILTGVTKEQ